jgi:spore coat protein A
VLGDCILVNGAAWPVLDVDTAKYRFRILNASNARRYNLTLEPAPATGAGFTQIGSDGGLLPAPVERSSVHIAPGERCDVVIDFTAVTPGRVVTLRNALGSARTGDIMRFRGARSVVDDARIPDRLAPFEPLSEDAAVVSAGSGSPGVGPTMRGWPGGRSTANPSPASASSRDRGWGRSRGGPSMR